MCVCVCVCVRQQPEVDQKTLRRATPLEAERLFFSRFILRLCEETCHYFP